MTNAELAILGLVVQEPCHGYEIERVISERGMREWTDVGFSSIYYLLKKLEREGLVESHLEEAARGPARRVYHPTPAGQAALQEGVMAALSVPRRNYSPLLLGLSHLSRIPETQAVEALENYRQALGERLAHVQDRWDRQRPLPSSVDAMFDYSVTMIQTELEWVAAYVMKLEGKHDQS
jgi:DNA-binding PadR family transcriptional regulator